jgi:predicted lipid-binding transport protein (Tim44 family)
MGSFIMMLLAGLAIFAVVRLLMRRSAAQMQPQPAGAPGYPPGPRVEPAVAAPQTTTAASTMNTAAHIPADFDAAAFLRQAKLNFIRLQAANDSGNMEDIRAFTAPEMYAEIQMQYQERGKAQQQTDVMQLEATLLDVTNEAQQQIASVRFFGLIRETADAAAENFSEVWHLTRPQDGSQGWMIAGIEQIN